MSGYKHATVTISQEEYQRLHEADMKRRFREFANINVQNSSREADLQNVINQMEERQRQLEAALYQAGQNSNSADDEVLQNIMMQNAACYQNIASALEDTHSSVHNSLYDLSEQISQAMQREREINNDNLYALMSQQDAFHSRELSKNEAAQQWLSRCFALSEFIQNQFEHERFAPGRLSRVLRNLSFAESNLADGFSESSLQVSQQTYLELSDLHFELEQTVIQWQTEFERTLSILRELTQQIEANSEVNALGLDGEELPEKLDLEYWTSGKFSQLLRHVRQLTNHMLRDQQCISIQDIDRIYAQILPVIRESFEKLIYEARLNALSSQLRMNIAEKALLALENHGFKLEESGYSEDDMRSQFNAILDSADGSQVTIQVLPTQGSPEDLSNELVVITTHPYLKTEHEARLHWEELHRTLNEFNLRVSRPEVNPESTLPVFDRSEESSQSEQKLTRLER